MPTPSSNELDRLHEDYLQKLREIREREEIAGNTGYKVDNKDRVAAAAELAKEEGTRVAKEKGKEFVKDKVDWDEWDGYGKKGLKKRLFNTIIMPAKRMYTSRIRAFIIFALGSFIFFSITQGPMQFVQFAEYLEETHYLATNYVLDNRLGTALVYAKTANAKERRNLSILGNKIASHYEAKLKAAGITPDYDGTFRIKAIIIDPDTDAGKKAQQQLREKGIPDSELKRGADGKIRVNIDRTDMGTTSTRFRRKVIGGMVGTLEMKGVTGAMAARVMKIRAGVEFHPLKNLVRTADERLNARYSEYRERVRQSMDDTIRNGTTDPPRLVASTENVVDEDGKVITSPDATDVTNGIQDQVDTARSNSPAKERIGKLRAAATSGFGATAIVGVVCAVQKIGEASVALTYETVNQPMIRQASFVRNTGNQIKSGMGTNSDEVGVVNDLFYDPETNTSWVDAASIQRNMGENVTGMEIPTSARPTTGTQPPFFDTIDKMVDSFPGGSSICTGITSTIGGVFMTTIGVALTATGPASALLQLLSEGAQQLLIGTFMDDLVAWLANDAVDPTKGGAYLGAITDMGGALDSNNSAAAVAAIPLTTLEARELTQEMNTITQDENNQKSFYARYLDTSNYHSLASTVMMRYSYPLNSPSVKSVAAAPFRVLGKAIGNFGNMFNPSVLAADNSYITNYGFEKFGFTVGEMDDPKFYNGYANEDTLLSSNDLADLNEKYGNPCFGITIDPTTGVMTSLREDELIKNLPDTMPPECKDRNNETLTRYRFYIADTYANLVAACWENIDISPRDPCAELHMNPVGAEESTQDSIRVATLNVLGNDHTDSDNDGTQGSWPSGAERMEGEYAELMAQKIQVAGLQELEKEQRAKFLELAGSEWGIFPETENYKNYASSNSIVWKTADFDFVEGGYQSNLQYFDGENMDSPWVKLRHKVTGKVITVKNTHDPVTNDAHKNNESYRVANAKKYRADILARIADGESVLLVGDFNSDANIRSNDADLERKELTYCILTQSDNDDIYKIQNAYDTSRGEEGYCPTTKNFSIDHVYHSMDLKISNWEKITTLESNQLSDHPLVFTDIAVGTGQSNDGNATVKSGWAWPVEDNAPIGSGPCYGGPRVHAGMDINTPVNNLKVYAMADGVVVKAVTNRTTNTVGGPAEGNFVMVKSTNIYSGSAIYYNYQHLQPGLLVKEGDTVVAGKTQIGVAGKTGNVDIGPATKAHLHIGFSSSTAFGSYGNPQDSLDPMNFLPKPAPGGYKCYNR
jgi:exonuclease III